MTMSSTVVLLRYFDPFSNQRPFQSLQTRVCNRTSLCLQQRPHTEVRSPTKTTFSHVKKTRSGAPVISRSSGAKKCGLLHSQIWTPWTSVCSLFVDKGLLCCTHECGGIETVSGTRMNRAAVDKFQRRLVMVIDVKGGHIVKWGYRLILMYISDYSYCRIFLLFMHILNY